MKSIFQKSRAYLFVQLFSCLTFTLAAQSPTLLKDINTNLDGSPTGMVTVGNTVFFSANDVVLGRELWKSDGTATGTVLVKDISPGASSGNPTGFCNVNGTVFFAAQTGPTGIELWKSDGTAGGTVLVKDINPEGAPSAPRALFAAGSTLYFIADDGESGFELWKTNGTSLGTKLVKDINPGPNDSNPSKFTLFNGTVYFTATGPQGRELWKTDGTPAGTVQIKDINPNGNAEPSDLTVFNNQLFFSAATVVDGVFDRELWKTTGTEISTVRVIDINPNGASMVNSLTVFNNALYFNASTLLYKSDGTEEGTTIVPIIDAATGATGIGPNSLTVANNTLFFFTLSNLSHGQELWKVTTADIASIVADIRPGPEGSEPRMFTTVGNTLMFTADDGIHGRELWKSDGTNAGTVLVQDLVTGLESSDIVQVNGFRAVRGADLFFSSYGVGGLELRRSDGTVNGVVNIRDIGPTNSTPSEFVKMGNFTYFVADDGETGRELWKTDHTQAGTQRVADIIPGASGSSPSNLLVVKATNGNLTLFFVAKDPAKGRELFKLENTANAVPTCISDILAGAGNPTIENLTAVNGTLHFTAYSAAFSYARIFKVNSSRTAVQTTGGEMTSADNLVARGSTLFFTQKGQNGEPMLCKIENGVTTIIKTFDLIPGGGSPMPAKLTVVGTTLFFTAADAAKGRELWKLENTANAIPQGISDIIVGPGSSGIDNLTDFNGVLHFTASSGQATGDRLFKTNAANTSVAAVGGTMSNADNLMAAGFKLFFTQSPEAGAPHLCKLENGTTTVLKTFDLLLDGQSSIPQKLTAAGDQIFFTAADAENGRELWKSDGDTTMLVSNIRDGVGGANILEIRLAGQDLFLSANNRTHGQEPWFLANAFALQGGAAEARLVVPVPLVIADGIKVYPNPATHFVQVDLPENNLTGTLSIVSASGQLVRSVQSSEGETSIQLDVQDLPKGIYLVRWVQSDNQVVVKKLMVQ